MDKKQEEHNLCENAVTVRADGVYPPHFTRYVAFIVLRPNYSCELNMAVCLAAVLPGRVAANSGNNNNNKAQSWARHFIKHSRHS